MVEKNKYACAIDSSSKGDVTTQIMDNQIKSSIEFLNKFENGVNTTDREEHVDMLRMSSTARTLLYRAARGWQLHEMSADGRLESQRLSDGRVIDLVRDPEHPESVSFVCWNDGEISHHNSISINFDSYGPREVASGAFKSVRLPFTAQPYGSLAELLTGIESLIGRCVSIPGDFVSMVAHFVIATWFTDRLPVAPYLAVVGMSQTGKTTLLRVLELLCRRALLASDISSQALLDACEQVRPTLLIDEAGSVINPHELRRLLLIGNTPPGLVLRLNKAWTVFGAKVITWRELPDDSALTSRCVILPMREVDDPTLMSPDNPEVHATANELQEKLLYYRLEHFDTFRLLEAAPPLEGIEKLRPRTRDLYLALTAPCGAHPELCQKLLNDFVTHNGFTYESLPAIESAVLAALLHSLDSVEKTKLHFIGDLAKSANEYLTEAGEKLRMMPRQVGIALAGLGFTKRRRDRSGWNVVVEEADLRRLHAMGERYGIEVTQNS